MNGRTDAVIVGAGYLRAHRRVLSCAARGSVSTVLEAGDAPGRDDEDGDGGRMACRNRPQRAPLRRRRFSREMFDGLGIAGERLYADGAADRRYILRRGTLHPLPMSPGAFVVSSLWSAAGKLRLLKEPFVGRAPAGGDNRRVRRRRLGQEFLDYAINPFVAGVYAGDPPPSVSVRRSRSSMRSRSGTAGSCSGWCAVPGSGRKGRRRRKTVRGCSRSGTGCRRSPGRSRGSPASASRGGVP